MRGPLPAWLSWRPATPAAPRILAAPRPAATAPLCETPQVSSIRRSSSTSSAKPVSAAITVAMQSAGARETLQASLSRANELTRELQDHHEKLQASELALKKQMTYVNDILGNMHSGLVVVDHAGRIQDCNPALLKLTGFDWI